MELVNKEDQKDLFKMPDSIVGEIKEFDRTNENAKRKGASAIGIFPTANNVIVKSTFKVKGGIVTKRENILKSSPTSIEVVAYGCETQELEIGDKVLISYHASVEMLTIPTNKRNIQDTQVRTLDTIKKASFAKLNEQVIEMEEFYSVPFYSIVGIDTTGITSNEMSLLDAESGNV